MAVESVGKSTVPKQSDNDNSVAFHAALRGAWKNEWSIREQARDQAKASGNETLAKHYQNELDVLRLMMPEGASACTSPAPSTLKPTNVKAGDAVQSKQLVQDKKTLPTISNPSSPTSHTASSSPTKPSAGNTLNFSNKRDTPMTIVFTSNADQLSIPSVTLKPGETLTQAFPENWSGNFRTSDGDGTNATLGEVKFNGGVDGKQTFYDVSYIEGNNSRMTIEPSSGGPVSGTLKDIVSGAPDKIKARDGSGNVYGLKKTTNAEAIDDSIANYYRTAVGQGEGYVVPKDDASTLGTSSNNLNVQIS